MKKILSVLLAACLMASCLVGCGGGGGTADNANAGAGTQSDANGGAGTQSDAGKPEDNAGADDSGEQKFAAFVTIGLNNPFFQSLADTFVSTFEANGWRAEYTDGNFNPDTQISACENYIAMGADILIVWAVVPEAMDGVLAQAAEAGTKVISFVQTMSSYDALMVSDEAELATLAAKFAAQWIDATYADAADGSVPVAVFCDYSADSGRIQGEVLLKIADFSKKVGEVKEIECEEGVDQGQAAAENLYTTNPEIQVFLTAHSPIANGIDGYYSGVGSPVSDLSKMGIFSINGSEDEAKRIADPEHPFRGTVLTGSVQDTVDEMLGVCTGVLDGTHPKGYVQKAGTTFVNEETVQEFLDTGHVTTITAADFE